MAIPVNALVWTTPDRVPPGGLWVSDGEWWLAAAVGAEHKQGIILQLNGQRAGRAIRPPAGMYGFGLGEGYTWRAMIPGLDAAVSQFNLGSILLSADGPYLWCQNGYDRQFAVTLAGEDISSRVERTEAHFPRWHVELVSKARPWEPVARLFSIEPAEAVVPA